MRLIFGLTVCRSWKDAVGDKGASPLREPQTTRALNSDDLEVQNWQDTQLKTFRQSASLEQAQFWIGVMKEIAYECAYRFVLLRSLSFVKEELSSHYTRSYERHKAPRHRDSRPRGQDLVNYTSERPLNEKIILNESKVDCPGY